MNADIVEEVFLIADKDERGLMPPLNFVIKKDSRFYSTALCSSSIKKLRKVHKCKTFRCYH